MNEELKNILININLEETKDFIVILETLTAIEQLSNILKSYFDNLNQNNYDVQKEIEKEILMNKNTLSQIKTTIENIREQQDGKNILKEQIESENRDLIKNQAILEEKQKTFEELKSQIKELEKANNISEQEINEKEKKNTELIANKKKLEGRKSSLLHLNNELEEENKKLKNSIKEYIDGNLEEVKIIEKETAEFMSLLVEDASTILDSLKEKEKTINHTIQKIEKQKNSKKDKIKECKMLEENLKQLINETKHVDQIIQDNRETFTLHYGADDEFARKFLNDDESLMQQVEELSTNIKNALKRYDTILKDFLEKQDKMKIEDIKIYTEDNAN